MKDRDSKGFTLLEMVITMTLLSIAMLLTTPVFFSMLEDSLDKESNRVGHVFRLARNEAILGNRALRVVFGLTRKSYHVEEEISFGKFNPRSEPELFTSHTLPDFFELEAVEVYGNAYPKTHLLPVPVEVSAAGFIDPFKILLWVNKEPWTLANRGLSGGLQTYPGHGDPP